MAPYKYLIISSINIIATHELSNIYQSGFRFGHSTDTALIDVTDYLNNNMINKKLTGAIFLDLKEAFDT